MTDEQRERVAIEVEEYEPEVAQRLYDERVQGDKQ